ncbi:MAG: hypothetical protein WC884_01475 [Candidatus Paceibacterota bacterium]
MDRKSKVFFLVLIIITLVSILLTFRRAFYTKDYQIITDPDLSSEIQ